MFFDAVSMAHIAYYETAFLLSFLLHRSSSANRYIKLLLSPESLILFSVASPRSFRFLFGLLLRSSISYSYHLPSPLTLTHLRHVCRHLEHSRCRREPRIQTRWSQDVSAARQQIPFQANETKSFHPSRKAWLLGGRIRRRRNQRK